MDKKPHLLIINDDGIHAPGIKSLWKSLVELYTVTIIAPAIEQSGVGLAITLRKPLHIEKVSWEKDTIAWKVTGTPADCVKMALSVILDSPPDLIVSGINRGDNSGRNVLYSGTVGGVIEGTLRNVPGVAFSCADFDNPQFHVAERYVPQIVKYLLEHPMPKGTFLNVNFPDHPDGIRGMKLARQGRGYWMENPDQRIHPEGRPYYWLGGKWGHQDENDESDVALLKKGFITAVPIHVEELTNHDLLNSRKAHFEDIIRL